MLSYSRCHLFCVMDSRYSLNLYHIILSFFISASCLYAVLCDWIRSSVMIIPLYISLFFNAERFDMGFFSHPRTILIWLHLPSVIWPGRTLFLRCKGTMWGRNSANSIGTTTQLCIHCVSKKNRPEINRQNINRKKRHFAHYEQVVAVSIVYLQRVLMG